MTGIKNVLITLLGIVIFLIAIICINHKIHISKETKFFQAMGQMVDVNDHMIHIYGEGDGETLVFMSGSGTSSPVLDFKTLYTQMSDEYRIVVVEKAGYGFSDISDVSRDLDTIIEETRLALEKSGELGPYVLIPHSMSGIEALYWAQKYPDEIIGIIGLDPSVPESYKDMEVSMIKLKILSIIADVGITRLIPSIFEGSAAIQYGLLDDEDKEIYKAVFYRRTLTKPMINEIKSIKENASKVDFLDIPNIPMLFFVSNGKGTSWNKNEWRELVHNYIDKVEDGQYVDLNCSHYVHNIEYESIGKLSKEFLENIFQTKEIQ